MADFVNERPEEFFHISRNAELVVAQDRDVVAFIPEMSYFDASSGMKIYRDGLQTSTLYESSPQETIDKARRVLLWGRLAGNELVSGMRWVPYTENFYQATTAIKPLIEVFAPRVVFDRTSNMLHLWFWTNVKAAYTDADYSASEIVPIGDKSHDFQDLAEDQSAKRVLCYTTGRFIRAYVEGGFLTYPTLSGTGFADKTFDLVPIFTLPKILNVAMAGGNGPGIVVDGWYAITGPQGPQGPQGVGGDGGSQGSQGSQGLQGWQGNQGWQGLSAIGVQGPDGSVGSQGPQGNRGWQGVQGGQGLLGGTGYQGSQGLTGSGGIQGPQGFGIQFDVIALTAGKRLDTTGTYLRGPGNVATNVAGLVVACDATIIGIGVATRGAETWTAEVEKNNLGVTLASLSISAAQRGSRFDLNVDVDAGDELQIYCNGTNIADPVVTVYLKRR